MGEKFNQWDYQAARNKYNLPDYTDKRYQQFVAECYNAGFCIRDYQGKNSYHGPAVVCPNIQKVINATTVEVDWDYMGPGFVVYPKYH